MMDSNVIEQVDQEDITLREAMLGYDILFLNQPVGAIEGIPGRIEYLTVELHWEEKGIARAALNEFIELSREEGCREVTTNNDTHPAVEHILETEGFEKQEDDIGWVKRIN